jgi:hypothetical protein
MRKKDFDVFICYSQKDRMLVESIEQALNQQEVKVWYDGWEMRPGITLLKSISLGIENADYFLAIISEHSINSSWVEHELNSAMIEEIEKQHVKVIPSIAGSIEHKQLPTDLRAKYSLDFRNDEAFQKSIDALVNLVRPEEQERKELLVRLRNPSSQDPQTIQELRNSALKGWVEYEIQTAAVRGLGKIGGQVAVLILTERLMNIGGITTISTAIKTLEKLGSDGGLLALTSTLLYDYRFYPEKLIALSEGTIRLGSQEIYLTLEDIFRELRHPPLGETFYLYRRTINKALEKLSLVSLDDIRYGVILAKSTSSEESWAEKVSIPEKYLLDQAREYAEKRVPGLINLKSERNNLLFGKE